MPEVMAKYDYLRDSKAPGDKFKAIEQCQKAFGQNFIPHKKDEKPFEVTKMHAYSENLIDLN